MCITVRKKVNELMWKFHCSLKMNELKNKHPILFFYLNYSSCVINKLPERLHSKMRQGIGPFYEQGFCQQINT